MEIIKIYNDIHLRSANQLAISTREFLGLKDVLMMETTTSLNSCSSILSLISVNLDFIKAKIHLIM